MKKSIGIVIADPFLVKWMIGKLKEAPAEAVKRDDMVSGLRELDDGILQSLMIECSDDPTLPPRDGGMHLGDLTIWKSSRKVTVKGREVMLTPKEFDILCFLAENRGQVMTKEQIYSAVWEGDYLLDEGNIMAFIRKLRKKIEPDPDRPVYILTVWGIGYKFSDSPDL